MAWAELTTTHTWPESSVACRVLAASSSFLDSAYQATSTGR
jgi:hypothetical protein